ncbi:hypothetical protein [Amycolatopsis coloradensis]|uniref:hypothetical protein n=1 Tax=Amycolatopsis coloradensis TaxID=76021 RepID=UPI001ABFEC53|nr:hypothetical protein [Amycolatopsis coloradensis]
MKRTSLVLAATVAAGLLSAGTASATGWTMSYLRPPGGDAIRVVATDGAGSYAGHFDGGLLTWSGWRVRNHGVPAGYTTVEAVDENASKAVLANGYAISTNTRRSFVFENGGFQLLEKAPGYSQSVVTGMNDRGDIVGSVYNDPRFGSWAAFWPGGDRAHPVVLDSPPLLSPVDIDRDGTILMQEQFGSTWLWKDGVARELVLPEGIRESRALAIRDGKVLADVEGGARVWTAYDTSVPVPDGMTATALNGSGLVTGCLRTMGTETIPAAWSLGGPVETLPAPSSGCGAIAGANGEIMGTLQDDEYHDKLVVWRRG